MRALKIIAVLYFAIAGIAAARAADLPDGHAPRNVFTHNVPFGHRAGPIIVYDFQPGVVVRAYWLPPWRHRHYFPFGNDKDDANATPDSGSSEPAETFERSWSTCDTCDRRTVRPLRARGEAPSEDQPLTPMPPSK